MRRLLVLFHNERSARSIQFLNYCEEHNTTMDRMELVHFFFRNDINVYIHTDSDQTEGGNEKAILVCALVRSKIIRFHLQFDVNVYLQMTKPFYEFMC